MNIPSYAEAVAIARKINVSGIMGRDGLADFGIKFMREAQEREMSTDDKLRRALEPFACVAVEWDGEPESLEVELRAYDNRMCPGIPVAAFRAAREALAATQEQPARFNGEQALTEWEGKHGGGK